MSKKNESDMTQLSAGQQKRLARKKEIAKDKRNKVIGNVCFYAIVGIIVAAVCVGIGFMIYRSITRVVMSDNFSAGLDKNGYVADVKASDIVELGKYNGMEVPYEKVKISDEDLQKKIDAVLAEKATMKTNSGKAIAKGDVINLDYVGTIDGVEFEGGSTQGKGTEITVGSAGYIDNFEEQLIGHKTGDSFKINVTFPDNYGKEQLNGKKAQFAIKINSIKLIPEFTDDFVKANFADKAETAEAYKQVLRDEAERENIMDYVVTELANTSKVTDYPKSYIKVLKQQIKYSDYTAYVQYSNLYAQYGLQGWASFEDFLIQAYGQKESQYDREIVTKAQEEAKSALAVQAVAEKEGLVANADKYKEYLISKGQDATTVEQYKVTYGDPFFMQQHLTLLVSEFIADHAVVTGK